MEVEKETSNKSKYTKLNEDDLVVFNIIITTITMLLTIRKKYFNYYKPKATIFLISSSSIIAYTFVNNKIEFIISIFFFISLLELIDYFLWKYPPFSWMFTIKNFSGTYEGRQVSQRISRIGKITNSNNIICKQFDKSLTLVMIIHQTGSKITISSFYYDSEDKKSSKSENKEIKVTKSEDGQHYNLSYHYGNIGVLKKGGHHGTTIIKLIKKEREVFLEGGYYTNRNPQTRGEFINLKRVSRKTLHPF